jgi:hypothetical protein
MELYNLNQENTITKLDKLSKEYKFKYKIEHVTSTVYYSIWQVIAIFPNGKKIFSAECESSRDAIKSIIKKISQNNELEIKELEYNLEIGR